MTCRSIRPTLGPDVLDIRKLYDQADVFTFDPGFTSTAACESAITFIDGDKGELLHRGYPIEQLAGKVVLPRSLLSAACTASCRTPRNWPISKAA